MESSQLAALRTRFEDLPFDTTRVGRHVATDHIMLGDFLLRVGRILEREVLSRPTGHECLYHGDTGNYLHADCTVAWTVAAVVERTAKLSIRVLRSTGITHYSVAVDVATRKPIDAVEHKDPAVAALLAEVTPATIWRNHCHLLDLWDWDVGLAHGTSGVTVHAHSSSGDVWLVETPTGSFGWTPVGRRNLVTGVPGATMPAEVDIRALFHNPPELVGVGGK